MQTATNLHGEVVINGKLGKLAANAAHLERPFDWHLHVPQSRSDFGQPETYLLHLRRVGFSMGDDHLAFEGGTPFGLYGGNLGVCKDQFVVILKNINWAITGFVKYESLEQLKLDWELD